MKVTKWSTFTGELTVSEQKPEQTSGEPTSLSVEPAVPPASDAQSEPVAASTQEAAPEPAQASTDIASPALAPEQDAATKMPEAAAPKVETAAVHASSPDSAKADPPRIPGKVIIMSSGDRAWAGNDARSEPKIGESQGMFGKRRAAALAAVVALATVAGALGGALATAALTHVAGTEATAGGNHPLEASVARIDADVLALRAGLEHTSKFGMSQFNKTSDRLDKIEKAQAEPAAKLARLSEAVDKLRAAPVALPAPVAAVPAAAKDVTGSVSPPAAGTPTTAPKVEVGRLPTVEGWVLRDVARGGALIDGRQGIFEVYAGDFIPGLGRIEAVRRQDGRWVVVTSKGLVVAR
jgi:hypothetical protein